MNAPYLTKAHITDGKRTFTKVFPGLQGLPPQFSVKKRLLEVYGLKVDRVTAHPEVEWIPVSSIPVEERAGWPEGARTIPLYSFTIRVGGEVLQGFS